MPGAARVFSGTYAESRLYQVMAEALQKIAEIKIKYPPNLVGPDTEERKEAHQVDNDDGCRSWHHPCGFHPDAGNEVLGERSCTDRIPRTRGSCRMPDDD